MWTRSRRLEIYEAILASGILPLFYTPEVSVAREVRAACDRAGATVLEFTARGPAALAVFEALADVNGTSSGVALGAGSVPDAATAALFLAAGAEFIVTPVLDPEIARLCNRRKVAYLPGCATLTEVAAAEELGAEIVKVFPASQLGGPGYLRAILAPRPWSSLLPTGGVDLSAESLRAWFQAGAVAVGVGSNLIGRDVLEHGDYDTLERRLAGALSIVGSIRPTD